MTVVVHSIFPPLVRKQISRQMTNQLYLMLCMSLRPHSDAESTRDAYFNLEQLSHSSYLTQPGILPLQHEFQIILILTRLTAHEKFSM